MEKEKDASASGGGKEHRPERASEQVLVVDDDPFIARLLEVELKAAGYEVVAAGDGTEALEVVEKGCPDLVLVDVMMPNMDGMELTRRLRQDLRFSTVSIIMLTAKGLSSDKLEGFAAGADDYIVKPFDTPELLARIGGVLRRARERRAESPLTGLPGNVRIEEEIERHIDSATPFALLYADLDHFKAYNDRYGFMRGDIVIRKTARLIQEAALAGHGPGAFVGHVGGDDFVVICSPESCEGIAMQVADKFDVEAPTFYDPEDAEAGHIEMTDRRGELQRFPLISISVGIASTERRDFSHYAEPVAIATEMKAFTKANEGSSWAIDRRTS